jgi:hypothetical protein
MSSSLVMFVMPTHVERIQQSEIPARKAKHAQLGSHIAADRNRRCFPKYPTLSHEGD